MTDHCRACPYDPTKRVGDDACPYTSLYWDFLARHRERFVGNARMAQPVRGLDRLADLPAVRARADEVRRGLGDERSDPGSRCQGTEIRCQFGRVGPPVTGTTGARSGMITAVPAPVAPVEAPPTRRRATSA